MRDTSKKGLFVTDDGQNLAFIFILVSSLFLLWGFCNGMIDVMDKHFQEELGLSKSQSAWVQFAHYLGYFLMSMPAGWLIAGFHRAHHALSLVAFSACVLLCVMLNLHASFVVQFFAALIFIIGLIGGASLNPATATSR